MGLSKRDIQIAAGFTIVEFVILPLWLVLGNTAAGLGILGLGLLAEHLISRLKG